MRLLLGLAVVFALFHGLASALGSDRGQAGIVIGVVVVAATIACECLFYGGGILAATRSLGLGLSRTAGVIAAGAVSLILLLVIPICALLAGTSFALINNWYFLLPGLFAQAGIAEEVLFRGYLFRRVRTGRPFWRAAFLSMLPFLGVHLILFTNMPFLVATAAVGLAFVLSFPLAHLYELGGGTIWAPALLHFVIQGAVKVVVVTHSGDSMFPLAWMAASAVLPWLTFLIRRPHSGR